MSQEKVDRRKAEKANRKEIMRKQKIKVLCLKIGTAVVAAAIVFWLGYSIYSNHQASLPRDEYSVNIEPLMDYSDSIGTEEEESADDSGEAGAEDAGGTGGDASAEGEE